MAAADGGGGGLSGLGGLGMVVAMDKTPSYLMMKQVFQAQGKAPWSG